jgi:hypothetical protein
VAVVIVQKITYILCWCVDAGVEDVDYSEQKQIMLQTYA